jgi:hypothetical protein
MMSHSLPDGDRTKPIGQSLGAVGRANSTFSDVLGGLRKERLPHFHISGCRTGEFESIAACRAVAYNAFY